MTVIATPLRNKYDHISYIVACMESREALALDPFDIDLTLQVANDRGLAITQILSTHEHWDHAGRNEQLRARTSAKVLGSKWAAGVIEHLDTYLVEGDQVQIGSSVTLEVIETPGHTMTHISLLGDEDGRPILLCGDTLFGAGVGNCSYGGHGPTLFETVQKLRARLGENTRLCPGHDYLRRNLDFALALEPGNQAAAALRRSLGEAPSEVRFTTIGEEAEINPFFRLASPELRRRLSEREDEIQHDCDVFLAVRRRRDAW